MIASDYLTIPLEADWQRVIENDPNLWLRLIIEINQLADKIANHILLEIVYNPNMSATFIAGLNMVDTPTQRSTATKINEGYKIAYENNKGSGYHKRVTYPYQHNLGQVPNMDELRKWMECIPPSEREALIQEFKQTLGIRMFLRDEKSGDKMRQITGIADGVFITYDPLSPQASMIKNC
ncbi:MAG: hypothetical protein NZM26_00350 [Patescibacteria group bacterium]|nr:hypothetical protein [Patescibacteria group bacterium]